MNLTEQAPPQGSPLETSFFCIFITGINRFATMQRHSGCRIAGNQWVVVWHGACSISAQERNTIAKKGAYIGAGAGLVLFAIFGLLPGSLMGGAAGINIAGWFFGLPLEPGLISRAIVLVSMLVGVLVAGIVIVTATSTVGWLVGRLVDSSVHTTEEKEAMGHR
jgi:small-conductance mechanosensitive channel